MDKNVKDFIKKETELREKHKDIIMEIEMFLNEKQNELGRKLTQEEFISCNSDINVLLAGDTLGVLDVVDFRSYVECDYSELLKSIYEMNVADSELTEHLRFWDEYSPEERRTVLARFTYPRNKVFERLNDTELIDCIMSFGTPDMIKSAMKKLGVKNRNEFMNSIQQESTARWLELKADKILESYI